LALGEKELYGHGCSGRCRDIHHVDGRYVPNGFFGWSEEEQRAELEPGLVEYGWRLDSIERSLTGESSPGYVMADVWFVPERDLPWPPGTL
jgi:hypothetical protein